MFQISENTTLPLKAKETSLEWLHVYKSCIRQNTAVPITPGHL